MTQIQQLDKQTNHFTMVAPRSPGFTKISIISAFRLFVAFQGVVILLLYNGLASYKKAKTTEGGGKFPAQQISQLHSLKRIQQNLQQQQQQSQSIHLPPSLHTPVNISGLTFPVVPMKRGHVEKCLFLTEKIDLPNNQTKTIKTPQTHRCLIHLHIGKNGGTSLDALFKRNKFILEHVHRPFVGDAHFDWSYLLGAPLQVQDKMDVLIMLRNPVQRAVSHFYFSKQLALREKRKQEARKLPKAARQKVLQEQNLLPKLIYINATISELLFSSDPNETLFDNRDIWQDGQAAVSWLTGTHIASWAGIPKEQIDDREGLTAVENVPMLLNLAADRLESTLWFGLMEDLPRSMELLSYVLGLHDTRNDYVAWRFPKANQGKVHHPNVTAIELEALASLMPQDLWLYEYGQRLFQARWEAYLNGQKRLTNYPERPPIPQLSCWSLRFVMNCTTGPLRGNYQYAHIPDSNATTTQIEPPSRIRHNITHSLTAFLAKKQEMIQRAA